MIETVDKKKVDAIMEALGCAIDEALELTGEAEFYENMSLEDLAYEFIQECYDLPEIAQRYFDYEAFARDLRFDNYYEVENGVIWIR